MKATRGSGFLENYLARCRARQAGQLIPFEKRNGCLVDMGCGQFPLFLQGIDFCQKVGIEKTLKPASITEANKHGISLRAGDLERPDQLPLETGSADVVTMLGVLEHLSIIGAEKLIRRLFHILKPDGLLALTTPHRSLSFPLRLLARLNLVSEAEINEHKQYYTPRLLSDLLVRGGFESTRIRIKGFQLGLNLAVCAQR